MVVILVIINQSFGYLNRGDACYVPFKQVDLQVSVI